MNTFNISLLFGSIIFGQDATEEPAEQGGWFSGSWKKKEAAEITLHQHVKTDLVIPTNKVMEDLINFYLELLPSAPSILGLRKQISAPSLHFEPNGPYVPKREQSKHSSPRKLSLQTLAAPEAPPIIIQKPAPEITVTKPQKETSQPDPAPAFSSLSSFVIKPSTPASLTPFNRSEFVKRKNVEARESRESQSAERRERTGRRARSVSPSGRSGRSVSPGPRDRSVAPSGRRDRSVSPSPRSDRSRGPIE